MASFNNILPLVVVSYLMISTNCQDLCPFRYKNYTCAANCSPDKTVTDDTTTLCLLPNTVCCREPLTQPPPSNCGWTRSLSKRTIGGFPVLRCSWPWLVSVRQKTAGFGGPYHLITGALVRDDLVVIPSAPLYTWNEFVQNQTPGAVASYDAVFGEHNVRFGTTDESQVVFVTEFLNSKVVGVAEDENLAWLKLKDPIKVEPCVHKVCTPKDADLSRLDMNMCKMVGWGPQRESKENEKIRIAPVPTSVNVTIPTTKMCKQHLKFAIEPLTFTDNMMCIIEPEGVFTTDSDIGHLILCPDSNDLWYLRGIVTSSSHEKGRPTIAVKVPPVPAS